MQMMQYTQQQRLAPEAPDESALYSPICDMVLIDDVMTSLMTSSRNNLCRNFGAKYLGNEAR